MEACFAPSGSGGNFNGRHRTGGREMTALLESLRVLASLEKILRHPILRRKNMGLLRTVLVFGIGFYSGVYTSQNYELPRVDDPTTLYEKSVKSINEFLEKYKKDP